MKRLLPVTLALSLVPSVVHAHPAGASLNGAVHGFTHPLFGWDHLLAMLAVGLWAAQRGGRSVRVLPATFVGVMIAGGSLGAAGISLPGVETGILASVLVLGAFIAAAARFSLPVSATIIAVFALFHGHAHGAEMPTSVSGLFYGAGFVAATALLHAAGVLAVTSAESRLRARTPALVRLAGATIALAAVFLGIR